MTLSGAELSDDCLVCSSCFLTAPWNCGGTPLNVAKPKRLLCWLTGCDISVHACHVVQVGAASRAQQNGDMRLRRYSIHMVLPKPHYPSAIFAMGWYLCVRLSVRHKPVLCQNGWTDRVVLWHTYSSTYPWNSCFSEHKDTSFWNFVSNSGLTQISSQPVGRRKCCQRLSLVYPSDRDLPPLCTAQWAWNITSSWFFCVSWDLFESGFILGRYYSVYSEEYIHVGSLDV